MKFYLSHFLHSKLGFPQTPSVLNIYVGSLGLPKELALSSLATPQVVITTTSSGACGGRAGTMTTPDFRCSCTCSRAWFIQNGCKIPLSHFMLYILYQYFIRVVIHYLIHLTFYLLLKMCILSLVVWFNTGILLYLIMWLYFRRLALVSNES